MAGKHYALYIDDEIVNQYYKLIANRSKGTIHVFDTFFFCNLSSRGYCSINKWTNNVNIFSKHKLFFPINIQSVHWMLVIVDFNKKTIEDFDSLGMNNLSSKIIIFNYLKIENELKNSKKYDFDGWNLEITPSIPLQTNKYDCGIFICTYAEYISRDAIINFTQKHMPAFRRLIYHELQQNVLLDPKKVNKLLNLF